jgi:hypothetical protein
MFWRGQPRLYHEYLENRSENHLPDIMSGSMEVAETAQVGRERSI